MKTTTSEIWRRTSKPGNFADMNHNWIVAQEGSRQSYAVPLAFHRLGALRLLYADIWCRSGRGLLKKGPKGVRALAGRFKAELPAERVVSFNSSAILFKTMQHFQRGRQTPEELGETYCRFGRWFATQVRGHLERIELDPQIDAFFGFDTNSLEAMESLKERGIFTVLDQVDPGRLHEELVIEETQLWPGWQKLPGRMPQDYWDRRMAEWQIADLVLVNSDWARQAIIREGVAKEKIIVVPLAIDLAYDKLPAPIEARGTLKVLWLGNIVLGKGIQYLVEAARLLERRNIEFLLAGPMGIAPEIVRTFPASMTILGRVTRDKLSEIYRQAHVFVLPTISDGFAVTQLEAMAHGLPVVITPNCGRVVTDGVDGLKIRPARAMARRWRMPWRGWTRIAIWCGRCPGMPSRLIRKHDLPSNAQFICDLARSYRKQVKIPWLRFHEPDHYGGFCIDVARPLTPALSPDGGEGENPGIRVFVCCRIIHPFSGCLNMIGLIGIS